MDWTRLTVKKIESIESSEVFLNDDGSLTEIIYKEVPTTKEASEKVLKDTSMDEVFEAMKLLFNYCKDKEEYQEKFERVIEDLPEDQKPIARKMISGDMDFIKEGINKRLDNYGEYYSLEPNTSYIVTFNENESPKEGLIIRTSDCRDFGLIKDESKLLLAGIRLNIFKDNDEVKALLTTSNTSFIINKGQYLITACI